MNLECDLRTCVRRGGAALAVAHPVLAVVIPAAEPPEELNAWDHLGGYWGVLLNLETGQITLVSSRVTWSLSFVFCDCSPSGEHCAIHIKGPSGNAIHVWDVATMSQVYTCQMPIQHRVLHPIWSPAGSVCAFHTRHGVHVLFQAADQLASPSGQPAGEHASMLIERIVHNKTLTSGLRSFSPCGRLLLVSSKMLSLGDPTELFEVPLAAEDFTSPKLVTDPSHAEQLKIDWFPTVHHLCAYALAGASCGLQFVCRSQPHCLISEPFSSGEIPKDLQWAPDGLKLAFLHLGSVRVVRFE